MSGPDLEKVIRDDLSSCRHLAHLGGLNNPEVIGSGGSGVVIADKNGVAFKLGVAVDIGDDLASKYPGFVHIESVVYDDEFDGVNGTISFDGHKYPVGESLSHLATKVSEYTTLGKLRGVPGVLQIREDPQSEVGVARGFYLVDGYLCVGFSFDKVEGKSLADCIDEDSLSPLEIIKVHYDVALALSETHKRGIVHYDVKPENIIVSRTEEGVTGTLIDYGISRFFSYGAIKSLPQLDQQKILERLSKSRDVFGSYGYMAPESFETVQKTPKSDLYMLGASLYESLGSGLLVERLAELSNIDFNENDFMTNLVVLDRYDKAVWESLKATMPRNLEVSKDVADAISYLVHPMSSRRSNFYFSDVAIRALSGNIPVRVNHKGDLMNRDKRVYRGLTK